MHLLEKMHRTMSLAAGASIASVLWTGGAQAFDEAAQIKLGEMEYMAQCASCHGPEGLGDGPVAEVLVNKPPDLTQITSRYSGQFPTEAIHEIIDGRAMINPHGDRGMPVWGYRYFQSGVEVSRSVPHEVDAQALAFGRVTALVKFLGSIQAE